jgi:multisubunit Na+/H+ antiporter MnhG subunit
VILRVALIAAFLVITTPISAFVIARAAYLRDEPMRAPDPVDESGRLDARR